ncbi:MAG: hypothetical protein K2R98_24135 [Gemmataceae bacterium]|nr:hypothetical protein [Gemmataceae bacterium]
MRRLFTLVVLAFSLIVAIAPLGAADDDEPKKKFPEKESPIPGPFHVRNVNGERKGRYHCLVCRNGLNPVAAVFVQPKLENETSAEWVKKNLADDSPLTDLFKKLDKVSVTNPDAFLGVFVVFIGKDDDHVAFINRVEALIKQLELKNIVFAVGTEEDPKDWFEKRDWETAVLLYKRHKVIDFQPFGPDKLATKDVDALVKQFDDLVPYYARPGYRPKLKTTKQ